MFPELNCSCVKFWTLNSGSGKALHLKHLPVSGAGSPVPAVASMCLGAEPPSLPWGWSLGAGVGQSRAFFCPHPPLSAIFLCLPCSPRCAQAAERAAQMETPCPQSTFLIVCWQIKAIFLSCICSHENLHHAQALASLASPAGKASPAVVWERKECLWKQPEVAGSV